jgi:hypothetical protein
MKKIILISITILMNLSFSSCAIYNTFFHNTCEYPNCQNSCAEQCLYCPIHCPEYIKKTPSSDIKIQVKKPLDMEYRQNVKTKNKELKFRSNF